MKKSGFQQQNEYQKVAQFVNIVSQQTFQSLPRIYGTTKRRILKNKNKFYQNMKSDYSRLISNDKQIVKKEQNDAKKLSNKIQIHNKFSKDKNHNHKKSIKQQTNQKPVQFYQKYKQIEFKIQDKISKKKLKPIKTYKTDDSQSKHKVNLSHNIQINTAMFSPNKDNNSDLDEDRYRPDYQYSKNGFTSKSVPMNNPLMNLYKKRKNQLSIKQKRRFNSNQIVEQSEQNQSPNDSINRYYVPKNIRKNQEKIYDKVKMKTQVSQFSIQEAKAQKMQKGKTQFSKRAISEKQKYSLFSKQDKYQIPDKQDFKKFIECYQPLNPAFNFKQLVKKLSFQIISYQNACYFGEIAQGLKSGKGVLITQKYIYQGLFQNDQKLKGHEQNFDGVYIGTFKNNLRNGLGKYEWNNGQSYEGNWKDGKKQGYGVWRSPNGDSYEGQWSNGRQNGKGTHKHKMSTFKGEFIESLKHGNGQEIFFNGDRYKGVYSRGKPHGFGRYDWIDGSFYEGQFKEGYRDGKGILYQIDGTTFKGSFKRDFKHGFGQQTLKSGQIFKGQFENGIRLPNNYEKI